MPPPGSSVDLSSPSVEPGGNLTVTGSGCDPAVAVDATIGGARVGTSVADPSGRFSVTVDVPDLPVGRYDLVVSCGPVFTTPIDIVVATAADVGNSTLALFVFFILLALVLFRRRRVALAQAGLRDAVAPEP